MSQKEITSKVPKLRFREFQSEWEEIELSQLISFTVDNRGKTPPVEDHGIPLIEINAVGNKAIDYGKITKYVSKDTYDTWFRKYLETGDILFSTVGATALCSIYQGEQIAGVTQNIVGLRIKKPNEFEFIYYVLIKQENNNKFKSIEMGAVQPSIKVSQMIHLTFPITRNTIEQQKIASFLTLVDEKIEKLKAKKSLLEKYKKGIMQKIFSRELRFRDENGEEFREWQKFTLSEIGDTYGGLSGKTKEDFGEGENYITYKQIFADSRIKIEKCEKVKINNGEKQNKAKYGDSFFTVSSETPDEIGFSSVLLDKTEGLYLNSFCFGFRPFSLEVLTPEFACFLFRRDIVQLAQGSTRYNMSKIQFLKMKTFIPEKKEQQKIASFLSEIDIKIEVLSSEIEGVEKWKKGILQGMFI